MLRTEKNEFKYLHYAVRRVDGSCANNSEADEDNCWLNLGYDDNDNPVKHLSLASCSESGDNGCYLEDSTTHVRTYNSTALKSLFGTVSPSDSTFNTIALTGTKQVYDVVLFIDDDDTNQNDDQGKTYSGNIYIETTSGGEKITGKLN